MNKQEFLSALRQSLSGEIPDYEVENNIRYYESYLMDDKDKSEEQKIKELGEPRLIAKTIADIYLVNQDASGYKAEHYSRGYDEGYDGAAQEESSFRGAKVRHYAWGEMKWYQKAIAVAIGIGLALILLGLLTLGMNIFFCFVLPALLILFGLRALINLFHK